MMMLTLLYIIEVISLIFNRFHLMMILLSIEYMYINNNFDIFFSLKKMKMFIMLLTSIVCEASLGLGLLVMFNYYGNEMMNSFNLIKC